MTHLNEQELQPVQLIREQCKTPGELTAKLKQLFAGAPETLLEAELDEHLGYEKNSVLGNNSGNSRNGCGHKTVQSEWGESTISVPRDRNGTFEAQIIEKRQTRTDGRESWRTMECVPSFVSGDTPPGHRGSSARNLWRGGFARLGKPDNG